MRCKPKNQPVVQILHSQFLCQIIIQTGEPDPNFSHKFNLPKYYLLRTLFSRDFNICSFFKVRPYRWDDRKSTPSNQVSIDLNLGLIVPQCIKFLIYIYKAGEMYVWHTHALTNLTHKAENDSDFIATISRRPLKPPKWYTCTNYALS